MHGWTNTVRNRNTHIKSSLMLSHQTNEQSSGQKVLEWRPVVLRSTCLIQRITAQYALLIPVTLCTTSISHRIYLVFKGLTQILQCSESALMLLGFKSHPFFNTTQPHTWTVWTFIVECPLNSSRTLNEFISNCTEGTNGFSVLKFQTWFYSLLQV